MVSNLQLSFENVEFAPTTRFIARLHVFQEWHNRSGDDEVKYRVPPRSLTRSPYSR